MPNHVPQKELIERLKTIKEVLKENETAATPDLVGSYRRNVNNDETNQ